MFVECDQGADQLQAAERMENRMPMISRFRRCDSQCSSQTAAKPTSELLLSCSSSTSPRLGTPSSTISPTLLLCTLGTEMHG